MFAGWITFSAFDDGGVTVAQAHVLMRASDPLYEMGMTFGGHRQEDRPLGAHPARRSRRRFGVEGEVTTETVCVDRRRQWSKVGERLAERRHPFGYVHGDGSHEIRGQAVPACLTQSSTRSSSAPARTGWRRRSRSPRPAARCACSRARRRSAAARAPRSSRCPGISTTSARRCTRSCSARRSCRRSRSRITASSVVHPDLPLAHPLDGGGAVALHRSLDETAAGLGGDGRAYRRLMARSCATGRTLAGVLLGPPLRPPRHPLPAARFAALGLRSAAGLTRRRFEEAPARALLAGNAAHSMRPLTAPGRGVRPPPCGARARRRVARGRGRLARDHRRHGVAICVARRRDRDRTARGVARRSCRRRARCCST